MTPGALDLRSGNTMPSFVGIHLGLRPTFVGAELAIAQVHTTFKVLYWFANPLFSIFIKVLGYGAHHLLIANTAVKSTTLATNN